MTVIVKATEVMLGPQPISRRWSSGTGAMTRTAQRMRSGIGAVVRLRPFGS